MSAWDRDDCYVGERMGMWSFNEAQACPPGIGLRPKCRWCCQGHRFNEAQACPPGIGAWSGSAVTAARTRFNEAQACPPGIGALVAGYGQVVQALLQ